jgi:hypothetical protein
MAPAAAPVELVEETAPNIPIKQVVQNVQAVPIV